MSSTILAPRPKLGLLDRYLSLWILLAMVVGVAIGRMVPAVPAALGSMGSDSTNIPLAVGLILMMYPPLAKVRYEALPQLARHPRLLAYTLLMNWVLAPLLMFALAALMLGDYPGYMQGALLVGIAPCIARCWCGWTWQGATASLRPGWWPSIACYRSCSSAPILGYCWRTCRHRWAYKALPLI